MAGSHTSVAAAAAAAAAAVFNAAMYKPPKVIFLKQEKVLLSDLVNSQLPSDINSKAKQPLVLRRKAKAWELITSAYNATLPASGPRTVKQLQKLWENLSSVAKRNEAKRLGGNTSSSTSNPATSSSVGDQHSHQQLDHDQQVVDGRIGVSLSYDDVGGRRDYHGLSTNGSVACEDQEDADDDDHAPAQINRDQHNANCTLTDIIAKHVKRRPPTAKFHSAKTRTTMTSSRLQSMSVASMSSVGFNGNAVDATEEILSMRRREHVAKMEKLELEKQKLQIERDYWARRYEHDFGCNNYAHQTSSTTVTASSSPHVWVPPGSIETVLHTTPGNVQLTTTNSSA